MSEPKEYMLLEISDNGERLLLDDASEWFVNPGDIPTVFTWLPSATIKVELVDPDDFCPYKLTLLNENISVRARRES